ncbi:glutamyl-tRNA reductase [Numidum massiliense]|uniref:glutamyl-tRNA reductase n=1 Tax=Numidum massiliense TaxID=1522315 RepID=UPI0006D52CB3|nr:glutamyl-tRNA reductase [Numidum massiliense]
MHLMTIGLNYKTAPVAVREQFAFAQDSLPLALKQLRQSKGILECVILSTCNRMEIYVVCDQLHTGRYYIKTFLEQWFGLPKEQFVPHLYILEAEQAVRHLFKVTCGLDSMVIGETQILGQVRQGIAAAQEVKTTGTILNKLFLQAVTVGKKAHSETAIGQNAVSVSYAAVELGKRIFGDFTGKTVLVFGAGEMSELTAKHLQGNGAAKVLVVNRSRERAERVARRIQAEAYSFDQLDSALVRADVVIASTGAEGIVLSKEQVARALLQRRSRPLFLIDIAVPRDIDPAVNDLADVYLYDIDNLQGIVTANMEEREREAAKVWTLITAELDAFNTWMDTLGVVPLITALREKALQAQGEAMQRIERKLPDLSERERRVISKQTKSIINQLLRDPIQRLKELAADPDSGEALALFEHFFALEELLAAHEAEEQQQVQKVATAPQKAAIGEVKVRTY